MISPTEIRDRLRGPIVPMTTPFRVDGEVDYDGLAVLTEFYISRGIKVLIAAGTTGYCYTLNEEEHARVVRTVGHVATGRALVIAGISQSGTKLSHRLAEHCEEAGADALLMTPPYYGADVCSIEGAYRHYKEIAESHRLGVIVYNRLPLRLDVAFFHRLAEVENIIGIKDASSDYPFGRDLALELADRFAIISGGGMRYYVWHWLWGAPAFVSGIANLVPDVEIAFYEHLQQHRIDQARQIIADYEQPFFEVMTEYGWHECLHAAMKLFKLPATTLRLPLVEIPTAHIRKMEQCFHQIGLFRHNEGVHSRSRSETL